MQIEKIKDEWIRRLGLTDWNIIIKNKCKPGDFVEQNCDGEVRYIESTKKAIIRILDGRYWEPSEFCSFDPEQILVHELLHIKFHLLDDSSNPIQDRIVHQLVDDMARALVDAKRSEPKKA